MFLALCLFSNPGYAQPCDTYFPMKQGNEYEMQNYHDNDKPTGKVVYKVLSNRRNGKDEESVMQMEVYDKKDKIATTAQYEFQCKNGLLRLDMRTMAGMNNMASGMDMRGEPAYLDMPASLSVGQKLADGHLAMDMFSKDTKMGEFKYHITNRQVVAKEKIKVPIGEYECYKITGDVRSEARMMGIGVPVNYQSVEWRAPGVGVVRSEMHRTNGKLMYYSLLSRVKL